MEQILSFIEGWISDRDYLLTTQEHTKTDIL